MTFVLFIMTMTVSIAQEEATETESKVTHKFSLNLGSVAGDEYLTDKYSTTLEFDFTYLYNLTDDVAVGASTGITNLFAKNDGGSDVKFLTLGGAFRLYTDNDKFFIGGEAGYSIGLDDGGFYYNPKIGVVISDCSGIVVSYLGVDDVNVFSSVAIGYEFSL